MKVVGLFVLGACTAGGPQHIVDSSGAPFALQLDGTIDMVDGTPMPASCRSGRAFYAWALGRFITIASACADDDGSWGSTGNRERPVACTETSDCPQWKSWSFECRSGLCQNTDTALFAPNFVDWSMVSELCYAPFPRADTIELFSPAALEVYQAVMSVCPSLNEGACTLPLPAICWQP